MKSNKTFLKRLKITKTGKVKIRAKGHNHFNAKASGRKTISKRRTENFVVSNKVASRYFVH